MPTPILFAMGALACFCTTLLVAGARIYLDGVVSLPLDIIQGLLTGCGMGALFLSWLTNH